MALNRRTGARFQASIWPGFVDAMTALLLVLMFVLSIFMIVQFMLRETITGQATELSELNTELAALSRALGLEQQRSFALESDLSAAQEQARSQSSLIATLTAQMEGKDAELGAANARITSFEAQVAGLLAQRDDALKRGQALEEQRDELLSEQEQLQLALSQLRTEVDAQVEAARLAAARRDALAAMIADLQREAAQEGAKSAALAGQVDTLQQKLSDEEAARLAEAAAAQALRDKLQNSGAELTAMTLALEEQRKRAEETLTLLAAARLAQAEAEQRATGTLSQADRDAALLNAAKAELAEEQDKSAESLRKVEVLNQQVAALRAQLGSLQSLLDEASSRDASAQVQLESLGNRLNAALAQVAAKEKARAALEEAERLRLEAEAEALKNRAKNLENYRSEFFGKLREVLAGREGVRIVGDRFVFSSEVLFEPASAELSAEGKAQIANVVSILRDISDQIPPAIDWIIRVDGHTDNTPLSGLGQYRDNWELSQGRALSVVRYMTDVLGFPPERLAATGFGEYRPVATGDSPEALTQNRRIELKLTER